MARAAVLPGLRLAEPVSNKMGLSIFTSLPSSLYSCDEVTTLQKLKRKIRQYFMLFIFTWCNSSDPFKKMRINKGYWILDAGFWI
jgi:hypothetical protein